MSKAILIIDMPKRCGECPICATYQEHAWAIREFWCPVVDDKDVDPYEKPGWCPLMELKEK